MIKYVYNLCPTVKTGLAHPQINASQSTMADAPLKPVDGRPKKIIVCCDGTWQSSVSGGHSLPSNITRIARTIAKAGAEADGTIWQQIVFYDAGVGTGSLSWFESNRQGATGNGLVANVIEG